MSAPDVADLVGTAALGYDLAADYELVVGNYRGGHGGLRADAPRAVHALRARHPPRASGWPPRGPKTSEPR